MRLVRIALGALAARECQLGDRNLDRRITVDEIVAAVAAALNDCAEPENFMKGANE